MESVWLKDEDALDRTKSKNDVKNHSGDPRWWEKPEDKIDKGSDSRNS